MKKESGIAASIEPTPLLHASLYSLFVIYMLTCLKTLFGFYGSILRIKSSIYNNADNAPRQWWSVSW